MTVHSLVALSLHMGVQRLYLHRKIYLPHRADFAAVGVSLQVCLLSIHSPSAIGLQLVVQSLLGGCSLLPLHSPSALCLQPPIKLLLE